MHKGRRRFPFRYPSEPVRSRSHFLEKAGEEYRGYLANLEETVGNNGSVITDYQFEQNMYSDNQFLKDSLDKTLVQEEGSILVADGLYSGKGNETW